MTNPSNNGHQRSDFPIAIIGAGFAGIGMAIQLKKAGIHSFTMFERAGEIGGTWRDNTYPGAACDVRSHLYSLSFEPNPDWTRLYAGSDEIQRYLLHCVEKYGLRAHLRTNTAILEARFDERSGLWTLATSNGDSVQARVVASGVGGLVDPAYPAIAGIDQFTGQMFHTARWGHDCDLAGKNVAVIGTGASAVQVVPSIAPTVGKLAVFQRTAAWVMPKQDRAISARSRRLFRRFPATQRLRRRLQYALTELMGPLVFMDWPRVSRLAEKASLQHLERSVTDPAVRARLTPSFQFGCKRVLISDDYWSAFGRENVDLVTEPIARICEDGIETADGTVRPIDVIILATGFAVGFSTAPFPVIGRGGRSINDAWTQGAVAYKGMTISGFPNWFIMMGPNTGPGHTSVLVFTESQIAYALQAIRTLMAGDVKYVDIRQDVQDTYNAQLQRRMRHTVWSSGCKSWYLDDTGVNRTLFPGFASEYCLRTRRFVPSEYEIVRWRQPADERRSEDTPEGSLADSTIRPGPHV
jgi:cation diffusion facilitator CzcD-associated flavoprotein CzcO